MIIFVNTLSVMSSILALALVLLAYSSETRAALTENQIALLEDLVYSKTLKDQHVTGMSISILQGDEFNDLYSRGYGFSDLKNEVGATNQTLFGIGSLSKVSYYCE